VPCQRPRLRLSGGLRSRAGQSPPPPGRGWAAGSRGAALLAQPWPVTLHHCPAPRPGRQPPHHRLSASIKIRCSAVLITLESLLSLSPSITVRHSATSPHHRPSLSDLAPSTDSKRPIDPRVAGSAPNLFANKHQPKSCRTKTARRSSGATASAMSFRATAAWASGVPAFVCCPNTPVLARTTLTNLIQSSNGHAPSSRTHPIPTPAGLARGVLATARSSAQSAAVGCQSPFPYPPDLTSTDTLFAASNGLNGPISAKSTTSRAAAVATAAAPFAARAARRSKNTTRSSSVPGRPCRSSRKPGPATRPRLP